MGKTGILGNTGKKGKSGKKGWGSSRPTHTSSSDRRKEATVSNIRLCVLGTKLEVVAEEVDTRRKHKKKKFVSFPAIPNCSLQASQPESSKHATVEKARSMEEDYHLSSPMFQEENKVKKKEYVSQLNENEQTPKLRERQMNISNNEIGANSAFCETNDFHVPTKESFKGIEGHSFSSTKELPTGRRRQQRRGDGRKTFREKMCTEVHLELLNAELKEVSMKYRKIEEEFENVEKEFMNSVKDRSTRPLTFQETGKACWKKHWKLQAFQNDLSGKATNVKNLTKELQQAKEVIHRLNLENQDLKETVEKLKWQTEIGNALLKDEMKLFYETEMGKIRGELNAIENDLKVEKTLQARNNRALEFLRTRIALETPSNTLDQFPGKTS